MTIRNIAIQGALLGCLATSGFAAGSNTDAVADSVIEAQRAALAAATTGAGFGPQAPRDIDHLEGTNPIIFGTAPAREQMNLCNIHFHESAEHKGGEYTTYRGNGDGHGYGSGYVYDGQLTEAELAPFDGPVGTEEHGTLEPGDTIEVHYVYSTAQVQPGPTLGSCLNEAIGNPQLRVEAVVAVLVNDPQAADFTTLTAIDASTGRAQVPGLPDDLGTPVVYAGSTTGPSYDETGSPFEVTWSVRPKVQKVNIATVAAWLSENPFDEDHAHGVRNLVTNPALLSAK